MQSDVLVTGSDTRDVVQVTEDIAPGYSSVIKQPMDLSTIRSKIATTYSSVEEMDKDVDLMVENAKRFNGPGSRIFEVWMQIFILSSSRITLKKDS